MRYQVHLDGVFSSELTHMVAAIEKQLNWHGVMGQAASGAGECTPGPGTACPDDGHAGHGPPDLVPVTPAPSGPPVPEPPSAALIVGVVLVVVVALVTLRRLYGSKPQGR